MTIEPPGATVNPATLARRLPAAGHRLSHPTAGAYARPVSDEQAAAGMPIRKRGETTGPPCCPLPPGVPPLDAGARREAAAADAALVAVARALADPVRLRMLALMASAGPCCEPPDAVADAGLQRPGVCVCELQGLFGLAQSTVSHHLRVLREAGLVKESRRGKWTFYRVDREAARAALAALARQLGVEGPATPPADAAAAGGGGDPAALT